jgi:hypothetical protein
MNTKLPYVNKNWYLQITCKIDHIVEVLPMKKKIPN